MDDASSKNRRTADKIHRWFRQNHGGSLILPDGWYGRPYDNIHVLSNVQAADDGISITLDESTVLKFDGTPNAYRENDGIEITDFVRLTFEDGAASPLKTYASGSVKFVSHPG